ncbi:MAG: hypothetical protein R3F31_14195 [Verrucomicrobiales bacterium]
MRERCGYDKPILVEEFLTEDISVGILGNVPEDQRCCPSSREDYSEASGWAAADLRLRGEIGPGLTYATVRSVPAGLGEKPSAFSYASCLQLFRRLGCRDYARFDWKLDARGTPRLLGESQSGLVLGRTSQQDGGSARPVLSDMLGRILGAAVARFERGKVRR